MNLDKVIVTRGPQDWQVLQQRGGAADIALEGAWSLANGAQGRVCARVVREDTGEGVLPWAPAETCGERAWRITLRGVPAGGLYRVETAFKPQGSDALPEWYVKGDMIRHVMVGDLYVIAGQSNSAGYGKDMILDAPELGVHLLRNNGRWDVAAHPLNDPTDSVHPANSEGANPGHSPWLSFAKTVKRETGMPVGLVQTSLGGSPLDDWLPGGVLYENMMGIIAQAGGAVRGVLWYQGCSDTGAPQCETYLDRFSRFAAAVRGALGDAELPIITVQICRHIMPPDPAADLGWSLVREAQRQAARKIPGVYLVPTMDCVLSDVIHIAAVSNMALGERAARIALKRLYGRPARCDAPDVESAKRVDGGIALRFRNVSERLFTFEAPVERLPLRVEDEAGPVPIAAYELAADDTLLIKTARPLTGRCAVSSHYGRDPQGVAIVDSGTRLPAPAFYGLVIE